MKRNSKQVLYRQFRWRAWLVMTVFALVSLVIVGRALQLQVLDKEFLERQADARHLRVIALSAHRGAILDRNGEPLAISTPVDSVWAIPRELAAEPRRWPELASLLEERGGSEGTTFAYKLKQVRRSLAGAAIVVALFFGGSM